MSVFTLNSNPIWSGRYYDEPTDENEYMLPCGFEHSRLYPGLNQSPRSSRSNFHPAYSQQQCQLPCAKRMNCNQRHSPNHYMKRYANEQAIPIHVSHEKSSGSDSNDVAATTTNKKQNNCDMEAKAKSLLQKKTKNPDRLITKLHDKEPVETENIPSKKERSFLTNCSKDEDYEMQITVDHENREGCEESKDISDSTKAAAENQELAPTSASEIDLSASELAKQQIAFVLNDFDQLKSEIDSFAGHRADKQYLRLEHELTNKLLCLDSVSAVGAPEQIDEIRAKRKAAVVQIQGALDMLESKASE